MQIIEPNRPQLIRRQHTLDGEVERVRRPAREDDADGRPLQAARRARVRNDALRVELAAREVEMRGVDNDHRVARENVVEVRRLVLAHEDGRDLRRQPPQHLVARVREAHDSVTRDLVAQPCCCSAAAHFWVAG